MSVDGIYHVVFGGGSQIGQGLIVLRNGHMGGVGHQVGEYDGTYQFDPATGRLTLAGVIKVPRAQPVTANLKGGPAGSSVVYEGSGPKPDPEAIYAIKLAGEPATLTLRRLGPLPGSAASAAP